jgi:hypothetical protein
MRCAVRHPLLFASIGANCVHRLALLMLLSFFFYGNASANTCVGTQLDSGQPFLGPFPAAGFYDSAGNLVDEGYSPIVGYQNPIAESSPDWTSCDLPLPTTGAGWIHIISPTSSYPVATYGDNQVGFAIDRNTSPTLRTGTISWLGFSFTITQYGTSGTSTCVPITLSNPAVYYSQADSSWGGFQYDNASARFCSARDRVVVA